jgi:hypothetical protein
MLENKLVRKGAIKLLKKHKMDNFLKKHEEKIIVTEMVPNTIAIGEFLFIYLFISIL